MSWRNPRRDLLLCAGLDLFGLLVMLLVLTTLRGLPLGGHLGWVATTLATYLVMCWLLGTYTLLGWPRLPRWTLLQRLGLALLTSLMVMAVLQWLLNPPLSVWVVHRSSQLSLLLPVVVWSWLVRVALHNGGLRPEEPPMLLVSPETEAQEALRAWNRTPTRQMLHRVTPAEVVELAGPMVLAVSSTYQQDPAYRHWLVELELRDPRSLILTTPLTLVERHLERLPPSLLPEPWLSFDEIPWNTDFSPQRQLKRVADVTISILLLLVTFPLLLLAALLIWIEDRGPVFYVQQRSGYLGEPFNIRKLRTMVVATCQGPAIWTLPGDRRITRIGLWLRRSRLDELPQLINVLSGDMSLIGPRPERPELELKLEAKIPHYRKRHWMRPGLSGWAQVNAPYAASVEDSELKLSYDLYYLKHFSLWLDMVILLRTLKTVLKVSGR